MGTRRRMVALSLAPLTALALTAGITHAVRAQPGAGGAPCAVQGTATLSPGLGVPDTAFTMSLNASFAACPASAAGSPAGGTVIAGSANGLPSLSGTGDCALTNLLGPVVIEWSDGTNTVIQAQISGFGNEMSLEGSVVSGVTTTSGTTIATTRYAGDESAGELALAFSNPAGCAGSGVTSTQVAGTLGVAGQD